MRIIQVGYDFAETGDVHEAMGIGFAMRCGDGSFGRGAWRCCWTGGSGGKDGRHGTDGWRCKFEGRDGTGGKARCEPHDRV